MLEALLGEDFFVAGLPVTLDSEVNDQVLIAPHCQLQRVILIFLLCPEADPCFVSDALLPHDLEIASVLGNFSYEDHAFLDIQAADLKTYVLLELHGAFVR